MQQPVDSVLSQIEATYPKETASQRFLHYDMLANIQKNNIPVAVALAAQLAERAEYVPSLFYRYVLMMLEAQETNSALTCEQLSTAENPAWIEYVLTKHFPEVLHHLTSKGFTQQLWSRHYRESVLVHHEDIASQARQFAFFLREYVQAFDKKASTHFDEADKDPFYIVIEQAKQVCL